MSALASIYAPPLRLHQPAAGSCPHCHRRAGQRDRRGLCGPCWRDKAVRVQYRASKRGNRFEHADLPPGREPRPPRRPTFVRPGTPKKRGILRFRARHNLSLFHPHDERITPGPGAIEKARRLFAALLKGGDA